MRRGGPPITTGVLVSGVIAALRGRAIDPAPLVERAGLTGVDPARASADALPGAESMLAELAADAAGDPIFGLRLAEAVDPRDLGLLYFLVRAAPTLRDALSLFERFLPAANSGVEADVTASAGGGAIVDFRFLGAPRARLKHTVEYHLAMAVRVCRSIAAGPVNPTRVTFAHPRLESIDAVEQYFGCPADFDAGSDRIVLARSALDLSLIAADPRLLQVLSGIAEDAAAWSAPSRPTVRRAVGAALRRLLPAGEAKVESVAGALGMTARTLSRRLEQEGTSYSRVLEGLRTELALQYLSDGSFGERSLDQIASALGYHDIAAFSRAFRRWTGHAPSVVRDNPGLARGIVEAGERGRT
ncbi:AraC family transcriptional regulator [Roseiarcus fermentans]|uniref:AraC family transcriptional regulator n=1 Tax=Roseiarcus fermentans TaxID=1473586 RepID=A0A366EV84_9HYPH|nr:AraC family transcriptional regulator [Roseiarcus fermentans]RBP06288.1 AraC family transcriptional regulator [Roseiarcus fermentans]